MSDENEKRAKSEEGSSDDPYLRLMFEEMFTREYDFGIVHTDADGAERAARELAALEHIPVEERTPQVSGQILWDRMFLNNEAKQGIRKEFWEKVRRIEADKIANGDPVWIEHGKGRLSGLERTPPDRRTKEQLEEIVWLKALLAPGGPSQA